MKGNNEITEYGYNAIIFFVIRAVFIGMGYYLILKINNQDSYISAIVGSVIGILGIIILNKVKNNKENLNILDLSKSKCGNILGTILNIIISVTFGILSVFLLYNYRIFISGYYIQETTDIYILFIIMLPVVYILKKDISVVTKVAQIVLLINATIFILSLLGMLKGINVYNIYPILEYSRKSIVDGALFFSIIIIAPILSLSIIPKSKVKNKKISFKKTLITYIVTCISVVIMLAFIILVLGKNTAGICKNPEYVMLKKISYFGIVEKIENSIALMYLFDFFIAISFLLQFVKEGFNSFVKSVKVKKYTAEIISIVVAIASIYIFRNSIFALNVYTKYLTYILGFGIILPVTTIAICSNSKKN